MGISVDDKGKGKRIIMQFFKTMANVQRALLALFEKDEYEGIQQVHDVLYPESTLKIDSIDNLRKGLSMVLQHIYSLPFEDKEGYFLEVIKCKSGKEVLRKQKGAFIDYFYSSTPNLKNYLNQILLDDDNYRIFVQICKEFLDNEEEVRDFRNFKNNLKEIQGVLTDRLAKGTSEDAVIESLKTKLKGSSSSPGSTRSLSIPKLEFTPEDMLTSSSGSTPTPKLELAPDDGPSRASKRAADRDEYSFTIRAEPATTEPVSSSTSGLLSEEEKRRAIETIFSGPRYEALRSVLLKTLVSDPQFATFQGYLDNIFPSAERIVASDLSSFSKGLEKIKEFRDNLEKELSRV
jgi:hypothetical protein